MIKFLKNTNSVWKKVAGILLFYILFSATITIFAAPPTTKYLPGDTLDPSCAPGDTNCTTAVESAVVNFTTVTSASSPYTVLSTDQVIYADTSGGDVDVTLPSIATVSEKRTIIVLKTSASNNLSVNSASGDYINETTALYITDNKRAVRIESIKANQWLAVPNFQELPVPAILVKAGTVSNLASTYDNGAAGVGATLTASPSVVFPTINGVPVSVGERVLVKEQTAPAQNGVYELTQATAPWILTRTTDSDETSEMDPQIVIATQGTTLVKGKQFSQQTSSPTLGTSNISYSNIIPSVQGLLSQQTTGTQVSGQIPFWTSTSRQLSKGSSALFWDDVNKRLGINDGTPDAFLDIESNSLSGDLLNINGGTPSGNSNGGGINILLGNGNALDGSFQSFSGGSFSLVAGNGDMDGTSGDPGPGGDISFTTGTSGNGDAATGNGGDFTVTTGSAGTTGAGGPSDGGSIVFSLGSGGPGVGANGKGGSFRVTGGDGAGNWDFVTASGEGGDIYLDGGQPGAPSFISPTGRVGNIFLGQTRGNVAIGPGITSATRLLEVRGNSETEFLTSFFNDGNDANRYGILVQAGLDDQSAVGPSTLVQFNDGDGGVVGSITFASSTTSFNTSSDERLKENIVNSSLTLEDLMEIKIRDFNWIADGDEKLAHGVIAQELYEVYPGAVTVPIEEDKYWMVDYSKLTPLVIKSIQDLNLKVDSISIGENSSGITIGSVISYLEESAQKTINGIVTFFEIITEKITTKKLCVEDVCVTRDEFLDLLEQNNIAPVPAEDVVEDTEEEIPEEPVEIPIEEVSVEESPEDIIEEPESVATQEETETSEPSL